MSEMWLSQAETALLEKCAKADEALTKCIKEGRFLDVPLLNGKLVGDATRGDLLEEAAARKKAAQINTRLAEMLRRLMTRRDSC